MFGDIVVPLFNSSIKINYYFSTSLRVLQVFILKSLQIHVDFWHRKCYNYVKSNNQEVVPLTYNEFTIELLERLISEKKYDIDESCVRFYADGLVPGDDEQLRRFVRDTNIKYHNVDNSDVLMGNYIKIQLPVGQDNGAMVRLDADSLYAAYKKSNIESVLGHIYESIEKVLQLSSTPLFERSKDYEAIKENLIIRPLNYDLNKAALKDAMYKINADIVLVLYLLVSVTEDTINTTKLPKATFESWDKPFDEVWNDALLNTSRLMPPRLITNMSEYSQLKSGKVGQFMEPYRNIRLNKLALNILTTTQVTNGAIAAFYPGVLERIADIAEDDLYLVFTSIDDAFVHAVKDVRFEDIKENLLLSNQRFAEDGVLTNCVFVYDRKKKIFYAKH